MCACVYEVVCIYAILYLYVQPMCTCIRTLKVHLNVMAVMYMDYDHDHDYDLLRIGEDACIAYNI
jgi:hypothetical protein